MALKDVPLRTDAPSDERGAAEAPALLAAGLDMAYQPIVHLGSGSVIAYEALARPRHPEAPNPFEFFRSLEQAGLRLPGERSAFEAALEGIRSGFPRVKLFVNASPLTLVDPDFDVFELLELAEQHDVLASDLVIEVTESEAVDDLATLSKTTRRLRRLGIGVAVDDAGAGHASFRVITRLRPSFIKLDRDLISNVDNDGARRAFVEAMIRFARNIGSRLIAEGIETQGELACLAGLGVEAGQGYFLARPVLGQFVNPSPDARRMIAAAAQRMRFGLPQVTARELARPAAVIAADVSVRKTYDRFLRDSSLGVLVVEDQGRAVAHVSRSALERVLAVPEAWSYLGDRPVRQVADHHPLAVDAELGVVELGAVLAASPAHDLIEDVLVTDARGELIGIAPVREIVRTLAELHRRDDADINALSGLCGPRWIEQELARVVEAGEGMSAIVVDVDGLRLVNEAGGYALGDELIRLLSRCLSGVAAAEADAALAHIGADEFVLLVPARRLEALVAEIVRSVESEVMPALRTELRLCGAIGLLDSVALSMASIDIVGAPPPGTRHLDWLSGLLAVPLGMAKDHAGYASVRASDGVACISTWWTVPGQQRRIALGAVDPETVLRAVALVEDAWERWWSEVGPDDEPPLAEARSFPGPRGLVESLCAKYCNPLRLSAQAAVARGDELVDVVLAGDEAEILELLDRLVLVTAFSYAKVRPPYPPELALLDRLLRQRARMITRQDVTDRFASPPAGGAAAG